MDEVDVHPVDLGRELRQRVQPRLHAPEVVLVRPVVRERPGRRELDALRPIRDELLAGPARRRDAPAEVVQLLLWNLELEGPDLGRGLGATHECLRSFAVT